MNFQKLTPTGCKDIRIRTFEFVAKTQFLCKSHFKLLIFRWKSNSVARNSAKFRDNLFASLSAIIAQFNAIQWCKRKQSLRATGFRLKTIFKITTTVKMTELYLVNSKPKIKMLLLYYPQSNKYLFKWNIHLNSILDI